MKKHNTTELLKMVKEVSEERTELLNFLYIDIKEFNNDFLGLAPLEIVEKLGKNFTPLKDYYKYEHNGVNSYTAEEVAEDLKANYNKIVQEYEKYLNE